jgi:hypothetical protein
MLDDVLSAIENATLLRPPAPIDSDDLVVIDDFAEAQRRARAESWSLARTEEAERILAVTQRAPNGAALREAVRGLAEPLGELVAARIPPRFAEIAGDVAADLENVVLDRMVPNAGTGLFARMWLVYVQGGWPCGMEDERLVAFLPPLSRDSIEVQ